MADATMMLTDETFNAETAEGLSLVDFWAPWCGPCRFVAPVIEELAGDYAGRVKVGKLNVDDNPKTAEQFRIMSIPTVMLLKDGETVEVMVGAQNKAAYQKQIDKHL